MRDRCNRIEVWQRLGLPIDRSIEITDNSEPMKLVRNHLFSRIVPTADQFDAETRLRDVAG
jgi:hypothetical protein